MNNKTDVEDVKKCLDWFLFKQCDMERVKDAYDSNTVWNAVCFARDALDAEPVRHGKWIDIDEQTYTWKVRCSCCGYERSMMSTQGKYPNYCEACGARMDADE